MKFPIRRIHFYKLLSYLIISSNLEISSHVCIVRNKSSFRDGDDHSSLPPKFHSYSSFCTFFLCKRVELFKDFRGSAFRQKMPTLCSQDFNGKVFFLSQISSLQTIQFPNQMSPCTSISNKFKAYPVFSFKSVL